jgi:hypothetical protein
MRAGVHRAANRGGRPVTGCGPDPRGPPGCPGSDTACRVPDPRGPARWARSVVVPPNRSREWPECARGRLDGARHLPPVDLGHPQIAQDRIHDLRAEERDAHRPTLRLSHRVSRGREQAAQRRPHIDIREPSHRLGHKTPTEYGSRLRRQGDAPRPGRCCHGIRESRARIIQSHVAVGSGPPGGENG